MVAHERLFGQNIPMPAREMSAQEAVGLIRAVDSIGLGLVTGTPRTLLEELSRRSDWRELTFSGGLLMGTHDVFTHPNVHYRASFFGAGERHYQARGGDVQFVPSFFRHYGLLIQHLNPRVMMMQASMPDCNGEVSLSLYNGAHLEECRRAGTDPDRLLIVECSPHFPRTRALEGYDHTLRTDEIDVLVITEAPPTELLVETGAPEDFAIAGYAASYIPDGATLQTGIGAVPNLVARALAEGDGGDYGVHSEMFTDGLFELAKVGKVTNSRKVHHRGVSVTTFALGSSPMYEYLHENPEVGFAPVSYTNDPSVIARNPRMVSINSALEIDLQGQIVADTLGARQYSGVGGAYGLRGGDEPLARTHVTDLSPVDGTGQRGAQEPYHWSHGSPRRRHDAPSSDRSRRDRVRQRRLAGAQCSRARPRVDRHCAPRLSRRTLRLR
jgi:acyl-CoA hydrolase